MKYRGKRMYKDADTRSLSSLLTKKQDTNSEQEIENQQDTDNHIHNKLSVGDVNRRLFLVTFLGKDECGEIVKGIEVMAENSEQAMDLIKQVSMSSEIYSAIDI